MPQSIPWDPHLLARVETLEWRSRVLVNGFLQGLHRSPMRGFSSEFSQYRPYYPGDELKRLDWRAYGRLDRLYVREYEAETNLRCQILVDASGSMGYRSANTPFRKYDYAALLAAALIRLLQTQRDACGLTLMQTGVFEYLPPKLSKAHFTRCLAAFEALAPKGGSDLLATVNHLVNLFPHRGLVAIFSDAWEDPDRISSALERLLFDKHDICFFQIVDPRELDFKFSESRMFRDMETGLRVPVTPEWTRAKYLNAVAKHLDALKQKCLDIGVVYRVLTTTQPPFETFAAFMAERERRL